MQVVVYSQYLKEGDLPFVQHLFDALAANGIAAFVNTPYLQELQGKITFKASIGSFDGHSDFKVRPFDFVITLGGDGTILAAATLIRGLGVPILGINLGRLGFLATVGKDQVAAAIGMLAKGEYTVGERSTLHLESDPPLFDDMPFALNDFTILKRDTSSMITVHAFVNGAYLNTYWADGLVVATPTGSTGYSLSCGGPIVFPDSNNFVLTPVAPHNLNVRPLVIADSATISFEVEGRTDNFLCTLDSRHEIITSDNKIAVRRGDFPVKVVQLLDDSFLDTMRKKLNWGVDLRNH
ncbi:MAG: NAD kinase [Saprospiraceae bacterium]|nr:NAD kinase [Saprospiraceae bacterium]MCF8250668.1 NAD kinase [Saprospiraceae bacterium]MCF8312520.1 NAD kinase [Saprospiraceae bacterium]MCF8440800.1 NAD kinase [Saprospiraceae bacterium]